MSTVPFYQPAPRPASILASLHTPARPCCPPSCCALPAANLCTVTARPPPCFPAAPRRLLDPQLATSYPSAILARERAIVVNLEFIKCIIAMGAWRRPRGRTALVAEIVRSDTEEG